MAVSYNSTGWAFFQMCDTQQLPSPPESYTKSARRPLPFCFRKTTGTARPQQEITKTTNHTHPKNSSEVRLAQPPAGSAVPESYISTSALRRSPSLSNTSCRQGSAGRWTVNTMVSRSHCQRLSPNGHNHGGRPNQVLSAIELDAAENNESDGLPPPLRPTTVRFDGPCKTVSKLLSRAPTPAHTHPGGTPSDTESGSDDSIRSMGILRTNSSISRSSQPSSVSDVDTLSYNSSIESLSDQETQLELGPDEICIEGSLTQSGSTAPFDSSRFVLPGESEATPTPTDLEESLCESEGELSFAATPTSEDLDDFCAREESSAWVLIKDRFITLLLAFFLESTSSADGESVSTSSSQSPMTQQTDSKANVHPVSSNNPSGRGGPSRKRRRKDDDNGGGSDDEGNGEEHPVADVPGTLVDDDRVMACPFHKHDPAKYSNQNTAQVKYRHCSTVLVKEIYRVKQHLYRVHRRPEHHCLICFEDLKDETNLAQHARQRSCTIKDCPWPERMTTQQMKDIKKRTPGRDPVESWNDIYQILFPGFPLPASPYVDLSEPVEHAHNFYQTRAQAVLVPIFRDFGRFILPHAADPRTIMGQFLENAMPEFVSRAAQMLEAEHNALAQNNLTGLLTPTSANSNLQVPRRTSGPRTASSHSTSPSPTTQRRPRVPAQERLNPQAMSHNARVTVPGRPYDQYVTAVPPVSPQPSFVTAVSEQPPIFNRNPDEQTAGLSSPQSSQPRSELQLQVAHDLQQPADTEDLIHNMGGSFGFEAQSLPVTRSYATMIPRSVPSSNPNFNPNWMQTGVTYMPSQSVQPPRSGAQTARAHTADPSPFDLTNDEWLATYGGGNYRR